MIFSRILVAAAAAVLLSSCSSSPEPFEEDWELRYMHTFDFMWDECLTALSKQYRIETADKEAKTITSAWDEHLAVMAYQGYRTRLIVTLEGDVEDGYKVHVKEEREVNTEQVNPEASSEAEWEPGAADGGSAGKFRVALHRQLNPKEGWREAEVR